MDVARRASAELSKAAEAAENELAAAVMMMERHWQDIQEAVVLMGWRRLQLDEYSVYQHALEKRAAEKLYRSTRLSNHCSTSDAASTSASASGTTVFHLQEQHMPIGSRVQDLCAITGLSCDDAQQILLDLLGDALACDSDGHLVQKLVSMMQTAKPMSPDRLA